MSDHLITVDLSKNPKQYEFFIEVVKACNGLTNKRKFAYGGAIRGGKTYVILFILTYLCKRYPGSKWAVIRDTFPNLIATAVESLKKIINNSPAWRWNSDKGNFFCQHENGSRIYFKAENLSNDKDLTWLLGLEVNGIFFEQLEELSQMLWDKAISRVGSWYIDPMPPAFVFTSFNPTQRWPKAFLYDRHISGTLPEDFFYMTALPTDNAFVTADQWNTWRQMADRYQRQYVEGDWTNFDDTDPRWLYAFDRSRHVSPVPLKPLPNLPIHLSFDFNINPITSIAGQHSTAYGPGSFAHILREWKLPNSNVHELCKQIRSEFPYHVLTVTGDATGRNRNAGYVKGDDTLWKMVTRLLQLAPGQVLTPLDNPSHKNSRFLCNAVLQNHPSFLIDPSCKNLIWEIENGKPVKTDNPAKEDQLMKGPGASEIGMNLLDCFRYYNHTHFNNFVRFPFS